VGAPKLIHANIGVRYSLAGIPEADLPHYTAWWDMHAFGAWLANTAARHGRRGKYADDEIVKVRPRTQAFAPANGGVNALI
jgi:hypothetical protein